MHVLVNIIGMKMFCLQQSLNAKKGNKTDIDTESSSEHEEDNF